jgi:hypothetical protein
MGDFPHKEYDRYVTQSPPEPEPFMAFAEWELEEFDAGKLRDHQIYMMLINGIKACQDKIRELEGELYG